MLHRNIIYNKFNNRHSIYRLCDDHKLQCIDIFQKKNTALLYDDSPTIKEENIYLVHPLLQMITLKKLLENII